MTIIFFSDIFFTHIFFCRFRELIASHYNSATGHATVSHHGLMDDLDEDDESPIIRGFNDKEPLVT